MKKILIIAIITSAMAAATLAHATQPPELQAAASLLQSEKWDDAEAALNSFIAQNPANARAWYLLASARHGKKNFGGAVEALKKNLAINENWPGMYNLAAAYARLNKIDDAFKWLEKSLNRGAAFAVNIERDEDFAVLRSQAGFKKMIELVDQKKNPCMYSGKARQFDFWIGDWDVFVGGRKVGENLIVLETGGCTLIENWKNTGGGTGKSINVYDGSVDKWKQFYVGSDGGVFLFEGGMEDGVMRFKAETLGPNGTKILHNFEFHNLPDKTVRQKWDQSSDEGKTWNNVWDSIYKKKGQESKDEGKKVSFETTDGIRYSAMFTNQQKE